MKKVALALAMMFALSGCKLFGPQIHEHIDWENVKLHRVGPNTVARVYRWDDEKEEWRLSHGKHKVPEGYFIMKPKPQNSGD
jgi:hypothetical protein